DLRVWNQLNSLALAAFDLHPQRCDLGHETAAQATIVFRVAGRRKCGLVSRLHAASKKGIRNEEMRAGQTFKGPLLCHRAKRAKRFFMHTVLDELGAERFTNSCKAVVKSNSRKGLSDEAIDENMDALAVGLASEPNARKLVNDRSVSIRIKGVVGYH